MVGGEMRVGSQGDPEVPVVPGVATLEAASPEGPAQPARRAGGRRALIVAGLLVVFFAILAGGIFTANASLSQTYSPQKAVMDYFTAQQKADATGMWANATFLRGEGSYNAFFSQDAVAAMMRVPANAELHDVKVTAIRKVDEASRSVTVSMIWPDTQRAKNYTVRKDSSRVHWLFYPSWKVEIPSTLISLQLPLQAGAVSVDHIVAPVGSSSTAIQSIGGFHEVTMASTPLLQSVSQIVDAVDSAATVKLAGTLSDSAIAAAGAAVKDAFNRCDAAKYSFCFDHAYSAPDSRYIYYFPLPGYGDVNYTKYSVASTSDPTAGMTLTVESEAGKVSVSGACTSTVTVDGSRHYALKGTFTGTLRLKGSDIAAELTWNCRQEKG